MKRKTVLPKGAMVRAKPVRPAVKVRHLNMTGRSAFPSGPAAFGRPDPAAGPALPPAVAAAAAPGDMEQ